MHKKNNPNVVKSDRKENLETLEEMD